MRVRRWRVGALAGQDRASTPVDGYELDTETGFAIEVWTYGATLVEVRVPDRTGSVHNVVLRHADLAGYEGSRALGANPYVGGTIGRFCRSVRHGRFELDGVQHQLVRNGGNHHLHGGIDGFDQRVWQAEVEQTSEQLALHLRLTSPSGDQGYPGVVRAHTIYRVHRDVRLIIEHRAVTTASTLVGLTNHAYWNLAGTGTIDEHFLQLNASRRVQFDAEQLPAEGPPIPVAGSPFDYSVARPVGVLDHFFVLDGSRESGMSESTWAAELIAPATGRRMRVHTNQPGLAVYTADGYQKRSRQGMTLQTSAWPDAPNRPDFPSVRLDPGGQYFSQTTHLFDQLS
jgi:aldose 1-epimerase